MASVKRIIMITAILLVLSGCFGSMGGCGGGSSSDSGSTSEPREPTLVGEPGLQPPPPHVGSDSPQGYTAVCNNGMLEQGEECEPVFGEQPCTLPDGRAGTRSCSTQCILNPCEA